MTIVLLSVHTVLCAVLFGTAWCRLVKTTERHTFPVIRMAFVLAATASLVLAIAPWASGLWPWFPRYRPHAATVLMLASFASVQLATARHWRAGTPSSFNREQP
ncbi:hypothetical protein [uncultured Ramlibacter sp.]|uniref:hypothetical protein n=1 Tax=uncultured Ramlibacter sp. TaxID=260755 RepID=UPI002612B447|nr:hypothetical protein [uncultured Ramlibacter sp.]